MTKLVTTPAAKTDSAGTSPTVAGRAARVVPVIIGISKAVAMPAVKTGSRGSKSPYDFEALEVGQSIGVKNKFAADLSSIISAQNRKKSNFRQKVDANGALVFVQTDLKDANGVVTGRVPTNVPEMEPVKHWFAADCAKDDPEGATVRIWRDK